MRHARGFTLVEVLVVVTIIALLVTILVPALGNARKMARRTVCATRLRGINDAIQKRAADPSGKYGPWPIIGATGGDMSPPDLYLGGKADVAQLLDATHENCIENLNLLVSQDFLAYNLFLCPGSTTKAAARNTGSNNAYGFYMYGNPTAPAGPYYAIDYGYHAGSSTNASWSSLPGDFPIMADCNADSTNVVGNTWNHGAIGVNVLTVNGRVWFVEPEADGTIAPTGDDIYVNQAGPPEEDALPQSSTDVVLVSPVGD